MCGQIGNLHRSVTWDLLRTRTVSLAQAGRLQLGSLPRLTVSIERVGEAFQALTGPEPVLQAALDYASSTGGVDGQSR